MPLDILPFFFNELSRAEFKNEKNKESKTAFKILLGFHI